MKRAIFAVCLAAGLGRATAAEITISMADGVYRVDGSAFGGEPNGGWEKVFRVHAGSEDVPALLGEYKMGGGRIDFRPRFRPAAGLKTIAVFSWAGKTVRREFAGSEDVKRERTVLEGIYPNSERVPANLLKFYLQFSGPMTRGVAWENLRLLDEAGKALDLPFLELDQELWDSGQRRLTVLFDPGRIKRGVLPREETGTALEPGKRYTLLVDGRWQDANGQALGKESRKVFETGPEERRAVDPKSWSVIAPRAGTMEAIHIGFDRPMDHALALRLIGVEGVTGQARLVEGDRGWEFTPDVAWREGVLTVTVETRLEDLAGNRVGKAFDVDVFDKVTKQLSSDAVRLAVRIGK